jgi:hypothetical protein
LGWGMVREMGKGWGWDSVMGWQRCLGCRRRIVGHTAHNNSKIEIMFRGKGTDALHNWLHKCI